MNKAHRTTDPDCILSDGLAGLGLDLPGPVRTRLLDYVALLARWNRVYNLTAVRDPAGMVTRHLLDSLAIAPFLHGERCIDVGSGPGLPGIPLALACPERRFTLLDSNGKKTRFLTQAVAELGLGNCTVVQSRVERYHPERPFDTVMTRAFATVGQMLAAAGHLVAPDGRFLAMKGAYPADELTAIPPGYEVLEVRALTIPGLEATRHLVCIGTRRQAGASQRTGTENIGNG